MFLYHSYQTANCPLFKIFFKSHQYGKTQGSREMAPRPTS